MEQELRAAGARFTVLRDEDVTSQTADALAAVEAVGWMRGAWNSAHAQLGSRPVLVDPRAPEMQKLVNFKVKFRKSFRPFAPAVLREDVADWFDLDDG